MILHLRQSPGYWYDWGFNGDELSVCGSGLSKFGLLPSPAPPIVKLTLRFKNPKQAGFKKVHFFLNIFGAYQVWVTGQEGDKQHLLYSVSEWIRDHVRPGAAPRDSFVAWIRVTAV